MLFLHRSPWRESLFSLKAFAAAILALYLSLYLALDKPAWAMLTAYIVAQPSSGMSLAKGVTRFLGTLFGAFASVVLLTTFTSSPLLLMLSLALWLGLCLFLAQLEKTVFNYAFLLAGYTAMFISLPYVDSPENMFYMALARVEEIGLGIASFTLIDLLILPRRTEGQYRATLASWLHRAAAWQLQLMSHPVDSQVNLRQQLLSQLRQLDELRQSVLRDSPRLRGHQDVMLELQCQFQEQYTLILAIEDRLVSLNKNQLNGLADLRELLGETHKAILLLDGGQSMPGLDRLIKRLEQTPPLVTPEEADPWHRQTSLAVLLPRLLKNHQQCQELLRLLDTKPLKRERKLRLAHYHEALPALQNAFAAMMSVCLIALFWHFTAWSAGYMAVMMTGVTFSLFASLDNPLRPAKGFFWSTLLSLPIAIFYQYVVLPAISDFGALVLVLAPFYLYGGYLMAKPATAPRITPMVLNTTMLLSISNSAASSIDTMLNQSAGMMIGIGMPLLLFGILREVGSEGAMRRLRQALDRQLAELARGSRLSRAEFESRSQEIMHGLLMRAGREASHIANGTGGALRIGLALLALNTLQPRMHPDSQQRLQQLRQHLADYFGSPARQQTPAKMAELQHQLLENQAFFALEAPGHTEARQRLGGILLALEVHQGFFVRARTSGVHS